MLNRFKDKNPSPLNNLDFILSHTHEQIINLALTIEKLREKKAEVASKLAATLEIMLMILRVKARLPVEQYEILRQYLSPEIDD